MNDQNNVAIQSEEAGQSRSGFLDRTLGKLKQAWQGIAGSSYDASQAGSRPDLPDGDINHLKEQMRACLESRGGEVSARGRAAALGHVYLALDKTGRERFLRVLAHDFDVDEGPIDAAIEELRKADGKDARRSAQALLKKTLDAPRIKLLTQFNALPDGVKFLVDMRAELLALELAEPALQGLEQELKALLATWFDVDFLELRRITWDNASAALLEKLIAYEAVHAINGWDDLKNRLDSDRRCFAYFHPRMPDEPLIFVQVALVKGLAGNVMALLDETAPESDPAKADTAIFYSISNAQTGLVGISFGGFLIKRVVDELQSEYKGLKTFATLSPIPGFAKWVRRSLDEKCAILGDADGDAVAAAMRAENGEDGLRRIFEEPDWATDSTVTDALEPVLIWLCARYLLQEKNKRGRARDPVAHFHLTNGAQIERLHWLADSSAHGLAQSAGMMVNYRYNLNRIEAHHEAYTGDGEVAAATAVTRILKK